MEKRRFWELGVMAAIIAVVILISFISRQNLQRQVEELTEIANASSIASAITLYNVLSPNQLILSVDEAKQKIFQSDPTLWPENMTEEEEQRALQRVVIYSNGRAKVNRYS